MKRTLLIFALLLVLTASVAAQERTLTLNEPTTDEMTLEDYEFVYHFNAKAGDVVMVEFSTEILGDLDRSKLILQSSNGRPLAENDSPLSISRLFAELQNDDTYSLIVTRPDGAGGDDVGEFSILVRLVTEMELNSPITDAINGEAPDRYYLYRGRDNFYLSYQRTAGEMRQEISINTINRFGEDGQLNPLGVLTGAEMNFGVIGTFFGECVYIIEVTNQGYISGLNPQTAAYKLELLDAAKLE